MTALPMNFEPQRSNQESIEMDKNMAVIDFYMIAVRELMRSLVMVNGFAALAMLALFAVFKGTDAKLADQIGGAFVSFGLATLFAVIFVCLVTWSQRYYLFALGSKNEQPWQAEYMNRAAIVCVFLSVLAFVVGGVQLVLMLAI